jgi:SPP1 family predicted phage head-tail adaptor
MTLGLKHPLGDYRHRLTVQRRQSGEPNAYREPTPATPVILAKRWARIESLTGREFWLAQQAQASTSHRVNLRYVAGLTSRGCFLTFGSRTFEIESLVDLNELHVEHELMCVEKS